MLKHSMYINNKNNNNKINIVMFDCFIYNFKRKKLSQKFEIFWKIKLFIFELNEVIISYSFKHNISHNFHIVAY